MKGRIHQAGVTGEERLGFEDRSDLGAGAIAGLRGKAVELRGRSLEGGEEPGLLDRDPIGGRWVARADRSARRHRIAVRRGDPVVGPKDGANAQAG
jgi:hypothetical protein